jgi:hypothetical protein
LSKMKGLLWLPFPSFSLHFLCLEVVTFTTQLAVPSKGTTDHPIPSITSALTRFTVTTTTEYLGTAENLHNLSCFSCGVEEALLEGRARRKVLLFMIRDPN